MLNKISNLLTKHDKNFLVLLVLFSIVISLIETFAVSIVMPFISIANNFEIITTNAYSLYIYNFFHFQTPLAFVIWMGVAVTLFYLFRGAINMFYFYMLAKFSEGRYFEISKKLFNNYLHLNNQQFNNLNSAHLTKMIINEASYLTQVISSLLLMISEIFIIIFIYALLFYVDWQSTLVLSFVLLLVVGVVLRKITRLVKTKGREREVHQRKVYDILASSFGNFKVIKLFSNEAEVVKDFTDVSRQLVHTNIVFETSSHIPRLLLDTLGFASLGFVVTFLAWKYQANISMFMPVLSLYVLALYRLLPSVHRIIVRYNKIMFYSKSIDLVTEELAYKQESLGESIITFKDHIVFKNVDFAYEKNALILEGIALTFRRGSNTGIIGESGSGKSTLVDMLIGLNLPSSGQIMIDGTALSSQNLPSWRKQIGYIPQAIYLFDGSVAENITFGRKHDERLLIAILKKVRLWETLSLKNGLQTQVGEGGKLLSGGQKQRIAMARALYDNPEILVLDEATSALDKTIEQELMEEIYTIFKDKTLIIISHNQNTLNQCDQIFHVKEKKVIPCE